MGKATARIRLFFDDAEHDFQLNIGELMELEEELDEGIGVIKARLTPSAAMPFGGYSVRAVRMILRLGLVGGGMEKEAAARRVDREVVPTRLGDCATMAFLVIAAAEVGVIEKGQDGDLGERSGETDPSSRPSPKAGPDGPTSTAPAAPSAGRRSRSTAPRSGSSSRRSKATA